MSSSLVVLADRLWDERREILPDASGTVARASRWDGSVPAVEEHEAEAEATELPPPSPPPPAPPPCSGADCRSIEERQVAEGRRFVDEIVAEWAARQPQP